jgi:hypothetical protein
MKEEVTLNRKEQNRLVVMNQIERKKLTVEQGAALQELSQRHGWRIRASYQKEGVSPSPSENKGVFAVIGKYSLYFAITPDFIFLPALK